MGMKHSFLKLRLKDKYDSVFEEEREGAAQNESVLMNWGEWKLFCEISPTLSNSFIVE